MEMNVIVELPQPWQKKKVREHRLSQRVDFSKPERGSVTD